MYRIVDKNRPDLWRRQNFDFRRQRLLQIPFKLIELRIKQPTVIELNGNSVQINEQWLPFL